MRKRVFFAFKSLLTRIGARIPPRALHQLQLVVSYLRLGRWMRDQGFEVARRFPTRRSVFAVVAEQVSDKPVLYLEFGVFKGKSLRFWSEALTHPESILHAFDSFEGLPEAFDVDGPYNQGTFDVGGRMPAIDDPRLRFFKGWFEDVLPGYEVPEHTQLILVIDADLYSSTMCVLQHLEPFIKPGSFIYFDDLSRLDHEPRAFAEFMRSTGRKFRMISADRSLNRAFFECTA